MSKSEVSEKKFRVLALCDSPLLTTGYARVARNILTRWHKSLEIEISCWAIGFEGWDYDQCPFKLFPAGLTDWNSTRRLSNFLGELQGGNYTHVWMMADPDWLLVKGFCEELRRICNERKIRSMIYFPVDAPLEREWLKVVEAVDVAATYTEYGCQKVREALCKSQFPIIAIPHGTEPVFRPLSAAEREGYRRIELVLHKPNRSGRMEAQKIQFLKPGDFFILNVNKNEWRKDPLRSLEILKKLRNEGVPAKLALRMDPISAMGGVSLESAAKQLGLEYGVEWCYLGQIENEEHLAGLYNAADLYLTTSMGEGWGLGVTEALACHCPVAMPYHTSLAEIGAAAFPHATIPQSDALRSGSVIWLPMEEGFVCGADTRLRRRVDLAGAVKEIVGAYREETQTETAEGKGHFFRRAPADGALKSWDHVSQTMWEAFNK